MDPGTRILVQMEGARRFNRWMSDTIAPFVNGVVLEAGAGIGNLTEFLFRPGQSYIAADLEDDHVEFLKQRLGSQPGLTIAKCNLLEPLDLRPYQNAIDTVICLNVLEHISDDNSSAAQFTFVSEMWWAGRYSCAARVESIWQPRSCIATLPPLLGSRIARQAKSHAGFRVDQIIRFNRITYPGWLLNSRLLKRTTLSSLQLRLFDLSIPLWRRIDGLLPWPPTSLIAIASREDC